MEYQIRNKKRLTKAGKIVIIIMIIFLLGITFILSKDKLFAVHKKETYETAKELTAKEKIDKNGSTEINNKIATFIGGEKEEKENLVELQECVDISNQDSFKGIDDMKMIVYQQENEEQEHNIKVQSNPVERQEQRGEGEPVPEKSIRTAYQRDLTQLANKKLVAFTFDDGPNNQTTNVLLDNLDKYKARVTFFVVGNRVSSNSEALKRAYDMGNQIGSHTYKHSNLLKLNNEQIIEEIQKANIEIKNVIGVEPTILRPPYGNINSEIKSATNMYTILWDLDTEDWKHKDAGKITQYILDNVHDGAIILLHDLYETSIEGALKSMEILEQEGYAFVTIDEMVELKQRKLTKEKSYYHFGE